MEYSKRLYSGENGARAERERRRLVYIGWDEIKRQVCEDEFGLEAGGVRMAKRNFPRAAIDRQIQLSGAVRTALVVLPL